MSIFDDVEAFRKRFNMPVATIPDLKPDPKLVDDRIIHIDEELTELVIAAQSLDTGEGSAQQLADVADAIIDIIYVVTGLGIMLGLPLQKLWGEVHRANMAKVPGVSKRGQDYDVVKPFGWTPPDLVGIISEEIR